MSSSEDNTPENQDSSSESHSGSGDTRSSGDYIETIQEIRHLTSQTQMWRIGSVVMILVIFTYFAWSMYSHIRGELPKTEAESVEFLQNLHKEADKSLIPSIKRMAADTLKDSRDEVSTQLRLLWENQGAEVIDTAASELDALVRGVPVNAISSYNNTLNEVLMEKMGDLKDPLNTKGGSGRLTSGKLAKVLGEALISSSTNHTGDIVAVMFKPHIDSLSSMSNHLNAIYDKEYPALTDRENSFSLSMALTLIEEVNKQLSEAEASVRAQKEAGDIEAEEKLSTLDNNVEKDGDSAPDSSDGGEK